MEHTAQGTLCNALWCPEWGGNPRKEGMYVYRWLIHFAVQQKHRKAILLQLKGIIKSCNSPMQHPLNS